MIQGNFSARGGGLVSSGWKNHEQPKKERARVVRDIGMWRGEGGGRSGTALLLTLHRLQEISRMLQPSVCAMVTLGRKPHGGAIAPAGARLQVISARGMPRQPQQHGAIRAVVIIVLLVQPRRDLIVHLLIVFLCRVEDLGRGGGGALAVEVVACSADRCGADEPDQGGGGGGLGRFGAGRGGGVEAVARVARPEGCPGSGG